MTAVLSLELVDAESDAYEAAHRLLNMHFGFTNAGPGGERLPESTAVGDVEMASAALLRDQVWDALEAGNLRPKRLVASLVEDWPRWTPKSGHRWTAENRPPGIAGPRR